jgi:flagellar assembly factor FliW
LLHKEIITSRFGTISIEKDKIINFNDGLIGFENEKRFCILSQSDESCFLWLQSIENPCLSFVVTTPEVFFPDYLPLVDEKHLKKIEIESLDEVSIIVVVNKKENIITANLLSPIIINNIKHIGSQIVISDKGKWKIDQPILDMDRIGTRVCRDFVGE